MKAVIIIIISLCALTLSGQSFKERIETIQHEYSTIQTVHIIMDIDAYENDDKKESYFHETADVKRLGDNYSSEFGSTNMMMNEHFLIVADKESKEIVYTDRSVKEQMEYSDPIKINLDSILALYDSPQLIGKSGVIEHYQVVQKNSVIQKIDLYININTNVLTRIEYRYQGGQFVVIDFKEFDKNPQLTVSDFAENKFMVLDRGVYRSSGAYKNYTVVAVHQ